MYYYSHLGNKKTEVKRTSNLAQGHTVSSSHEIQALQMLYQALFQKDYLRGVAFYGLGTVIISKGCAIRITTYLVPLTPSGIVVSFLNNCLNKEVHLCSISVPV